MILAADAGGTKTLIGLFEPGDDRPLSVVSREYATLDFESLEELVETFLDETGGADITAFCVGVAGPVSGLVARLTNAPWLADAGAVARRLGGCPVAVINDLEAMATAIPVLTGDEVVVLQGGIEMPTGDAAILAAGTGMGQALLHNVDGAFVTMPSEGGHADFSARTPREMELAQEIVRIYGRAEVESVISGRGLLNIFRFTHGMQNLRKACRRIGSDLEDNEMAPAISRSALEGACERCVETLQIFVDAYGAEAGNLALRCMATAGVYVGGGIAPKILPALTDGRFMATFRDKAPMTDLLRTFPVRVIVNPGAALVGAAVTAEGLAEPGWRRS
jgi:glucokinase